MQLKRKRATVFGVNRSGIAAAKLLRSFGTTVTVTDTRSADALSTEIAALEDASKPDYKQFLEGHPAECIEGADFIVVSPGVPLDIPILVLLSPAKLHDFCLFVGPI